MVIDELVAKFSIKVDSNSVKKFNTTVGGLAKSLNRLPIKSIAAGSAIGILAEVMSRAVLGLAPYATGLSNLSQSLDVPVSKLQALQLASKEAGVSFNTTAQAVGVLQSQFSSMLSGKGFSPQIAAALGALSRVSGKTFSLKTDDGKLKTTAQLLQQVFNALKGIKSNRQAVALSQRLFGGANLLPVINKYRQAQTTVSSYGVDSSDFIAKGKELQETLAKLGFAFKQLSVAAGIGILEPLKKLTESIEFWSHPVKSFKEIGASKLPDVVPTDESPLSMLSNKLKLFRSDAIKQTASYHTESATANTQNSSVTNAPVTNNVSNTQNIHYNNSNAFLSSLLIPEIR